MSAVWRYIFWAEIPLISATVLYWLVMPYHYLTKIICVERPNQGERFLLALYAGVTLTMVGGYYAFMLATVGLSDPSFIAFQKALLLGDVFIVAATLVYVIKCAHNYGLVGQVVMAAIWGLIRVVFLVML